jgi:gliding motility-associated-like protein
MNPFYFRTPKEPNFYFLRLKVMRRFFLFMVLGLLACLVQAQNLVPNPSFEEMQGCEPFQNDIHCTAAWLEYLGLDFENTPDLGFEGAVFFPPSTIAAFDGNQYLNIECSTGNPEYVQVDLIAPLEAGTEYCVSFYASVWAESPEVAPSLGVYFTNTPLTDSPFELGLAAHVQGPVNFDPTSWTLISGTYIAQGGESILVLSGFENTGTMPFPYMYIDAVSVIALPPLVLEDESLCNGPVVLDASAPGASYAWSTGETTASIEVNAEGEIAVERTFGACVQTASVTILECDTVVDIDDPSDTLIDPVDEPDEEVDTDGLLFFAPNAFTPNGDGVNDVYGVIGPLTEFFHLQIYNRWGQVVFESDNIFQRWTGNHSGGGHFVPDGIYIYQFKARQGNTVYEDVGHVLLFR